MNDSVRNRVAYVAIGTEIFDYEVFRLLKFAREVSDYLVCGIVSDEVLSSHGYVPKIDFKKRKER